MHGGRIFEVSGVIEGGFVGWLKSFCSFIVAFRGVELQKILDRKFGVTCGLSIAGRAKPA
jgi:hypothetical protein